MAALVFTENQNWLAQPGTDPNIGYTIAIYIDPLIGGPTPKYFARKTAAGGIGPLANPVGPGSPGCSPGYYNTLQDAEAACQTDYGP